MIYISGVFGKVEMRILSIRYLSFMDDLGFLTAGHSANYVRKILDEARKIALEWGSSNIRRQQNRSYLIFQIKTSKASRSIIWDAASFWRTNNFF